MFLHFFLTRTTLQTLQTTHGHRPICIRRPPGDWGLKAATNVIYQVLQICFASIWKPRVNFAAANKKAANVIQLREKWKFQRMQQSRRVREPPRDFHQCFDLFLPQRALTITNNCLLSKRQRLSSDFLWEKQQTNSEVFIHWEEPCMNLTQQDLMNIYEVKDCKKKNLNAAYMDAAYIYD